MNGKALNILVADDDSMTADGLSAILKLNGLNPVGKAANGIEAMSEYDRLKPDLVFMDIGMPAMNGIDATRHIVGSDPDARIIGVSGFSEVEFVKGMLAAGAMGFVWKASGEVELLEAVMSVMCGKKYFSPHVMDVIGAELVSSCQETPAWRNNLTRREGQILALLSQGKTPKEIGSGFALSTKTVEKHVHNIKDKLGVKTGHELIARAYERKILLPGGSGANMALRVSPQAFTGS